MGKSQKKLRDLAKTAHANGQCLDCGACGKPFTRDRKPRSAGLHEEPGRTPGFAALYLLCGECARLRPEEIRRQIEAVGDVLPDHVFLARSEARGHA